MCEFDHSIGKTGHSLHSLKIIPYKNTLSEIFREDIFLFIQVSVAVHFSFVVHQLSTHVQVHLYKRYVLLRI